MGFAVAEDQEFALPPLEERPLVTFALFAYNQEEYIREAVEGAFAQTYEPLEIILSDDCSTDKTFELMEEIVNKYIGSHKVVIRRSPVNRGLALHISDVAELARGELIVVAAGDDVSKRERVYSLAEEWIKTGKPAAIYSGAMTINSNSELISTRYASHDSKISKKSNKKNQIKNLVLYDIGMVLGCTAAYRRGIFETCGPLKKNVVNEDSALSLRASILGGIHYIEAPLVLYRVHGKNLSHRTDTILKNKKDFEDREILLKNNNKRTFSYLEQWASDIEILSAMEFIKKNQYEFFKSIIKTRQDWEELKQIWWDIPIHDRLIRMAFIRPNRIYLEWAAPRLLGIKTYCRIRYTASAIYRKLKIMTRRQTAQLQD